MEYRNIVQEVILENIYTKITHVYKAAAGKEAHEHRRAADMLY
jgi:hypothetical protein